MHISLLLFSAALVAAVPKRQELGGLVITAEQPADVAFLPMDSEEIEQTDPVEDGRSEQCRDGKVPQTVDYWKEQDTNSAFQKIYDETDKNDLVKNIGRNWGIEDRMHCQVPENGACNAPLCRDLIPPEPSRADEEEKVWMVLKSVDNFNSFLDKLHWAFVKSNVKYATLQVAIQQEFWPGVVPGEFFLAQCLSALGAAIGIVCAWFGPMAVVGVGAAAGNTFKELFTGTARGITQTLAGADISLKNIAEHEHQQDEFYTAHIAEIGKVNNDMMSGGKSNDKSILDLFSDGAWVDTSNIPILNTNNDKPKVSVEDAQGFIFRSTITMLVGYSWEKQNTWIVSLAMSEEDCKNSDAGESDLKLCHNGRAYWLQRLDSHQGPLHDSTYAIRPPGVDKLSQYGLTVQDIMRSSVDAYDHGGYDFDPESMMSSILETPGHINAVTGFKGLAAIPVCELESGSAPNYGDPLISWVDKPGLDYNDIGLGGFCGCLKAKDKFGKMFKDQYPGIDPPC